MTTVEKYLLAFTCMALLAGLFSCKASYPNTSTPSRREIGKAMSYSDWRYELPKQKIQIYGQR
jgi:hypothetical protein